MTRFPSLAQAGSAALQGEKASQDSQAILDAMKAEFGVGKLSCSPPMRINPKQVRLPQPPDGEDGHSPPALKQKKATEPHLNDVSEKSPLLKAFEVADALDVDNLPDTAVAERAAIQYDTANEIDSHFENALRPHVDANDSLPSVPDRGPGMPTRKMDPSQDSPTQVNADRDYGACLEPLPPSPVDVHTQHTATKDDLHTLNIDDTGAVNFGHLSELGRPSSQVSEDGGFENTRGDWRRPDDTSQLLSNQFTPYKPPNAPPETPAFPKNPFGVKNTDGAVPFGGTQLFGQTQMLSSAVKLASPTSSRPSPNLFMNSISPNMMETSPLKNRTNVSSPTDIRTSSPTRLHEIPATVMKDKSLSVVAEDTPVPCRSQKDELIPESPTYQLPKPVGHEPLAHYEPMKQSQQRKTSNEDKQLPSMASDTDSGDDTFQDRERKRRVERKRAIGLEEMGKVCFARTQRLPHEPAGRKRRRLAKDSEPAVLQPVVRDSQKATSQLAEQPSVESTKATPGEEAMAQQDETIGVQGQKPERIDEEMIPATSPVRSSPAVHRRDAPSASEPELPALRTSGSDYGRDSTTKDDADSSSLPPLRHRSQRTYGKRGREIRTRLAVVSSAEDAVGQANDVPNLQRQMDLEGEGSDDTAQPNTAPPSSYSEPPVAMGTRSRCEARTRTPKPAIPADVVCLPTSSSLTNLSGTPLPSSKTTPGTQDSHAIGRHEAINLLSSEDSILTRNRSRNVVEAESPQPMIKAMRLSRRIRADWDSADEPQSPSATAPHSKSVRSFRTSLTATASRNRRLFDGMVFALSFSESSQSQRTRLETRITQAGGAILHEGFHELFEQSTLIHSGDAAHSDGEPLRLTKGNADGFAAVIADSHSRKAKYMQALAMGLPCLAPHWVTACLNRGDVIDWTPYLLCAGASQVLGNAIRSRTLVPYPAITAKLAERLQARDKLLDGENLLIVMDQRKSRKEAKQQYLFLALALGPLAVRRVSTVKEAREAIRHAQKAESPFSWIYVDSSTGTYESIIAVASTMHDKKRRKSAAAKPTTNDPRLLTDELMIQSLILGRMVEDGEMD